jgi:hypothetical protein
MKQAQKGLTRPKGVTDPRSEEWAGKEVKVEVRVRGGAANRGFRTDSQNGYAA